jgi:tetratricopeptide (TPR) repeat protein
MPALLTQVTLALALLGPAAEPTPAEKAFHLGQKALEGDRFDEAVGQFELCLRLDPAHAQAHLSLAAAHLALGEDRLAAPHLGDYLAARPDHFLVRMPYAELLARLERLAEAGHQLERFVEQAQEFPRIADDHLIACHTRLMEIAAGLGDEYAERLHRGIGLYLLALKRAELGGAGAPAAAEELLCKAAGELTLARLERPGEARPCWYLHGVWERLGQRQPAERSLRAAERHAGLSYLTPAELRRLHLAAQVRLLEQQKR